MSDLNDQSEVCFDHPSPSLLVSLLNTRGQLNLLLRSQQRGLADLSKVNARLRIVSHAPTSSQIGSEATAGSVEEHQLISDAIRKGLTVQALNQARAHRVRARDMLLPPLERFDVSIFRAGKIGWRHSPRFFPVS
jgi:hypothetical protein